jgi:Uma2 family endonuclease
MATATMKSAKARSRSKRVAGEPVWELAKLLWPVQGDWTEEDYLKVEYELDHLVELRDGFLQLLPMPSPFHQRIVKMLLQALDTFVVRLGKGEVAMAPLPVRLCEGNLREPDICYFASHRIHDPYRPPNGVDLVMEVVSPGDDNRKRDVVIKRKEYAKAGVREYWIVDPDVKTITVLTLAGKTYKAHGVFKEEDNATSKLLKGFHVSVTDVFAAGAGK